MYAITETWLHGAVCNGEILSFQFNVFRCDRPTRGGGGGVMLAVHSSVSASALDSPSNLEVVCVKLSLPFSVLFCVVYVATSVF